MNDEIREYLESEERRVRFMSFAQWRKIVRSGDKAMFATACPFSCLCHRDVVTHYQYCPKM